MRDHCPFPSHALLRGEVRRGRSSGRGHLSRRRQPSNFTIIEIALNFRPNVSSRARRRNNSPAHETIFHFACRRPETFADYQLAQGSAAKPATGEPVMQNVIAINAAAREGIIAAQATSYEMLLEIIPDRDPS